MKKKTVFISLTIFLFILVLLGIIQLFRTRVFRWSDSVEIDDSVTIPDRNSQNIREKYDYATLVEKKLIVPETFAQGVFEEERVLRAPEEFTISLFAAGFDAPRFFDFGEDDVLFVTDKDAGTISLVKDTDNDGVSDEIIEIDSNLQTPHGIDYYDGDLYVGEEHQVVVYKSIHSDGTYASKDTVVAGLPTGGHATRTVVVGPDEKLYVSIGSSCNVCEETDERRSAIVQYDLDGTNEKIFARGLRNTVGFIFFDSDTDGTKEMWGVNNGRDRIGDDIPPEEVNRIEEGKHYGWPYCYGEGVVNPEFENEKEQFCTTETAFPVYEMQAHSAPLGVQVMNSEIESSAYSFPSALNKDMFIAFHGSWNRTVPTGYKVVRIDTNAQEDMVINFITGWLQEDGEAWGRPVGVGFDSHNVLYISDDKAGAIYRVTYTE